MMYPSFFFAIFKRLQVCDPQIVYLDPMNPSTSGGGFDNHFALNRTDYLAGGFALFHPDDPNGMLGKLLAVSSTPMGLGGQSPLGRENNNVPITTANVPLYQMLSTCALHSWTAANGPPITVPVNNQQWPPMPYGCSVLQTNPGWTANGHDAVTALSQWIENGQHNDEPQGLLHYPTLNPVGGPWPVFPNLPNNNSPLLFVCSVPNDNGVRPLSASTQYWNTSLIYLAEEDGTPVTSPPPLQDGQEYYLLAAIGNSGNVSAGRLPPPNPPAQAAAIYLEGWAMAFGTGFSPAVQLPSLSNLDVTSTAATYEQYFLPKQLYDVVGFLFNVENVFNGLVDSLLAANINFGALGARHWVEQSQPSVKVFFTHGGQFKHPIDIKAVLNGGNPAIDCGVGQKNLSFFDIPTGNLRGIRWTHFIAGQMPGNAPGRNRLQIRNDSLPADSFRFLLAVPTQPFENYVRKAGGLEGFEVARDVSSKPFPDAVILRETVPGSLLDVASHERETFLGMSLGVEYDTTRLPAGRAGTVSVVHYAGADEIVGGLTIAVTVGGDR